MLSLCKTGLRGGGTFDWNGVSVTSSLYDSSAGFAKEVARTLMKDKCFEKKINCKNVCLGSCLQNQSV